MYHHVLLLFFIQINKNKYKYDVFGYISLRQYLLLPMQKLPLSIIF